MLHPVALQAFLLREYLSMHLRDTTARELFALIKRSFDQMA